MLNRGLDKQELLRIVDSVANEKSIDKELILNSMETAIQRAAYSKFGFENLDDYGATKAAQIHIAKTWQNETKSTGPRIHIFQPNPMPTALRGRFYPGENRNDLQSVDLEAKRLVSLLDM